MPYRFQWGNYYTRTFISQQIGGGIRNYLPHHDGNVVRECFTREKNPNAPQKALPGNTQDKIRWATRFADQNTPVPVLVKQGRNRWEYVGLWRVEKKSTNPKEIAKANADAGRTDVAMVLSLVEEKGAY